VAAVGDKGVVLVASEISCPTCGARLKWVEAYVENAEVVAIADVMSGRMVIGEPDVVYPDREHIEFGEWSTAEPAKVTAGSTVHQYCPECGAEVHQRCPGCGAELHERP
jgi:predicted RNA-binding Zn-ribbon protein involved in translation (DUF1610 family)